MFESWVHPTHCFRDIRWIGQVGPSAYSERRGATDDYCDMVTAPEFLVIDDNRDSRFLLTKTLLRKFPAAVLHECETSEAALATLRSRHLAAIISHRSAETPGIELLLELRALNRDVPIVMVSGVDRKAAALAAGANRFFLYDEWLRIGTVVDDVLAQRSSSTATT